MAVKKSKMVERFKALFPKINLSKERLNILMGKLSKKPDDKASDDEIDDVLTDFNETYPFEDILKNDDRTRKSASDAKKKADEEAEEARKKAGEASDGEEEEDLPDDTPEYIKKLFKQNKALAKTNATIQEQLTGITTGKITDTKTQQVQELFKNSDALKGLTPEMQARLVKTVDFESETPIEDQVESISTEYSGFVQSSNDAHKYAGGAGGGAATGEIDQKAVDNVVNRMNI